LCRGLPREYAAIPAMGGSAPQLTHEAAAGLRVDHGTRLPLLEGRLISRDAETYGPPGRLLTQRHLQSFAGAFP
jgi:hypothetical protein